MIPATPPLAEAVLVPKRLFSTPGPRPPASGGAGTSGISYGLTPSPLAAQGAAFTPAPAIIALTPTSRGSAPTPSSAGQVRPASRSSSVQQTKHPIRYGVSPADTSGYFERFAHGAHVRRFGLLDGFSSSSEDDEEDEAAVHDSSSLRPRSSASAMAAAVRNAPTPIAEVSPVESMLHRLTLEWQGAAEQRSAERAARLHEVLHSADQELASELQHISEQVQRKQMEMVLEDVRQADLQHQVRNQKLQELQRLHDKAAAKQQEHLDKLAAEQAARKRAQEEEACRRKAEAAAARAVAEAASKAAAEQKRWEEDAAAKQKQEQEAAAAKGKEAGTTSAGSSKATAAAKCMRCAPQAQAFEAKVAVKVDEMHAASIKQLVEDESLKKQRRDIEKKMTVHVQQISATIDQVQRKCADVHGLIASQSSMPWRHFAMLMFATKFVKQWELVMLNNKAAFPLATVLVKVSTVFPELMDFALSIMHRECCFSVPCCFVAKDEPSGLELTPGQLRRLLGYKEVEDPAKPGGKVYESDDDFMRRIEGVMFLYGAIVQVQEDHNPHGLEWGWRWLARFLNALPATRAASKALIFFLRSAGYGLYGRYKGQFVKLLRCMHDEFLPELSKNQEPEVQSVRTLLEHYLHSQEFAHEPEGRNMPKIDMSSFERA